jgi:hypothetical protein
MGDAARRSKGSEGRRGAARERTGAPILHQLLLAVAGVTVAFVALLVVGVAAMAVVLIAAGWAAAQYDDAYRRRGATGASGPPGASQQPPRGPTQRSGPAGV